MFYSKVELINKISENGLIPLNAKRHNDNQILIVLEDSGIDELLEYAKSCGSKHIFYIYEYCDEYDYFIEEQLLQDEFGQLYDIVSKEVRSYNAQMKKLKFSDPSSLLAFCLHQGQCIAIDIDAPWTKSLTIAEYKINEIRIKYAEQLAIVKNQRERERVSRCEKLEIELREMLLHDEEYALCTNQKMRRGFVDRFMNRNESVKFKELFLTEIGTYSLTSALGFLEMVWSLRKK